MKSLIILTLIAIVTTSCMQARNRSAIVGSKSDGANYEHEYPNGNGDTVGNDIPGFTPTEGNDDPTDDAPATGIPSDASHCTWASTSNQQYTRDTNHLGKINICQSKTTPLNIFVQVKTPVTATKVCAIPMYEYSGRSIYLGNPRCIFIPDNKVYTIPLLKNRSGSYSQYSMTSVMLIKDMKFNYPAPFATSTNLYGQFNGVDAFLYCSQYLDRTGVGSYCNAFNSINQHVYHSFNKTY